MTQQIKQLSEPKKCLQAIVLHESAAACECRIKYRRTFCLHAFMYAMHACQLAGMQAYKVIEDKLPLRLFPPLRSQSHPHSGSLCPTLSVCRSLWLLGVGGRLTKPSVHTRHLPAVPKRQAGYGAVWKALE